MPSRPHLLASLLSGLGLSLTLTLGHLAPAQAAPSSVQLNIAVSDIGAGGSPAGGGLVDVIHAQQRLEKALSADGVEIKWHFFKGAAPLINEAFANGQVDMAYLGDLGTIVGKAGGLDSRVVAVAARGVAHYLAVPVDSQIQSLADLKGKRVGLFRGTAAQLSFIGALQTAGLTEKDISVINLDFAAASAALAAKQIDATWGGINVLALRERGQARVPVSTRQLNGAGELAGLLLVSQKIIDQHPQWVDKIVQVQREAAAWASDPQNRDAYIQLLADQAAYPANLLRADLEDAPPLSVLLSPELDPGFTAQLKQAISSARNARLIRRDIDVEQWLAPQFLQHSAP
ncbi:MULTISPECIES: ABC transporter substrate-binding protein [Pseudomonas syringae group]|uniref:ABC transporter substrate-binding protein n=1 Tax=Pseudomonas syringae group TaxID=136849 RepID=UPI000BB5BA21|nr:MULTISPECIES: ABC transporter substrate-binding protein [Pseudomonas syringae group]MDU8357487.1 ABC transporter substrate-binding protein [Pseudomonas syringae group sp. J309-1]PBQ10151.1 nitrate ABC transporter substrate-binding protein [Pseudomonas syringae]